MNWQSSAAGIPCLVLNDCYGTDLKQTTYSGNANYRDEWYLGRFIPNVPTEILSVAEHPCIPTSITIIASYFFESLDYTEDI